MKIISFLAYVILIFCNLCWAQPVTHELGRRAAQYVLGDKDQILMQVNIWGRVAQPGNYWVPRDTDLITLLSLAGGPAEGAKLSQIRIIRAAQTLETGNGASNGHTSKNNVVNLKIDVKDYLDGDSEALPALLGGDTIIIGPSFGHKFRNAISYLSLVTLVAQVGWWVSLAVK